MNTTSERKMENTLFTPKNMAMIAVMTAVLCILGPLSIPINAVPISFTNLAVYFAIYLLGTKRGTLSYLLYLLLGTIGLPVFSGYAGGLAKLAGPTGGYIIGFVLMALIQGIFIDRFPKNYVLHFAGMTLGTLVCYLFGTIWFIFLMKVGIMYALTICVFPFLIGDLIKILLALVTGPKLKSQLTKAGLAD